MHALGKNVLAVIAASALLVGAGLRISALHAQQNGKLFYMGIGGATQEALRKAYFEPFQKETGIQVVEDTGLSAERVEAEVRSGHPTIDVTNISTAAYAVLQAKGLLAPIDYKYYDPANIKSDVGRYTRQVWRIEQLYLARNELTVTAAFPEGKPQPNSWADFWDVKKFPGKRTLPFCGVLEGDWPLAGGRIAGGRRSRRQALSAGHSARRQEAQGTQPQCDLVEESEPARPVSRHR